MTWSVAGSIGSGKYVNVCIPEAKFSVRKGLQASLFKDVLKPLFILAPIYCHTENLEGATKIQGAMRSYLDTML